MIFEWHTNIDVLCSSLYSLFLGLTMLLSQLDSLLRVRQLPEEGPTESLENITDPLPDNQSLIEKAVESPAPIESEMTRAPLIIRIISRPHMCIFL